jgi:hypothetical protein
MGNETSSVKGSRLEKRVFESFQLFEELVDKLEFANAISGNEISAGGKRLGQLLHQHLVIMPDLAAKILDGALRVGVIPIIEKLNAWAAVPRGETISQGDHEFVEWLFEYWPAWVNRHWVRGEGVIEFGLRYTMRTFEYVLTQDPAYCGRLLRLQHDEKAVPEESVLFIVWLRERMEDYLNTPHSINPILRQFAPERWHRDGNSYSHDSFRAFNRKFPTFHHMIRATKEYAHFFDIFTDGW